MIFDNILFHNVEELEETERGRLLRRLPLDEFERRVDRFTDILARDGRMVCATSIFGFNGDDEKQILAREMREIVRKYTRGRLPFIDGLQLLDDSSLISADGTHPSLAGIEQIADRWASYIKGQMGFIGYP